MTGNLQMQGNELFLQDNGFIRLGTSEDLQIYHNGTNSYIKDTGTGNLIISGNVVNIKKADNSEHIAVFNEDGACVFYHNDSVKLSTASTGTNVTGSLYATSNIGLNDGDCMGYVNNTRQSFYINGLEEMRLESDGDLHVDGDVIAYSTTISDATLKYNINPVEFALDKIKQLKGVTFNYLKDNKASAGLLAQDVEKIMPSAVRERKLPLHTGDDKLYKTLHYDSMTAILVEAIKELSAKVEELENK
jgi:hypothetical protein